MSNILLFDFDGTIADSFENFITIIDKLAKKYHFEALSRNELEELRSEEVKTLMKRLNIPFYKLPFLARDMKKLQQEEITKIETFAGLPEVLRELKSRGYTLGIVTSNGADNVRQFIKAKKIDFFDHIHSDTSIFGKAKVISNFLKNNAVKKDDVIYIGDEIRDIQACQSIGVKIIAVTWGFTTKEGLIKHKPDFIVDKPTDLLQVLSK